MKHYFYLGGEISQVIYEELKASKNTILKRTLYVQDDNEIKPGVCRICGCTELDACNHPVYGPCSWADDEETICSWCADGVLNKREKIEVEHRLATIYREIVREGPTDEQIEAALDRRNGIR